MHYVDEYNSTLNSAKNCFQFVEKLVAIIYAFKKKLHILRFYTYAHLYYLE